MMFLIFVVGETRWAHKIYSCALKYSMLLEKKIIILLQYI